MKTFKQLLTENRGDSHLATELFLKCRIVATYTHFQHLVTKSYAQHMALAGFYEEIIELLDKFMESYIGRFGHIETIQDNLNISFKYTIPELKQWIDSNRSMITDSSELQNILDEILELCNSTIYKLENLH